MLKVKSFYIHAYECMYVCIQEGAEIFWTDQLTIHHILWHFLCYSHHHHHHEN